MGSRLEERVRATLAAWGVEPDAAGLTFAVDFTRLAVRSLSFVTPKKVEKAVLAAAIKARTGLDDQTARTVLALALTPEFKAHVGDEELESFAGRFGEDAAAELQAEDAEELDLAGFTQRYGTGEALLLLDTMFAVCGADGEIEASEVYQLQQAARDLGVDGVLVSALLQKHDPRHGAGRLTFPLAGDRIVIGRAPGCEVHLPDPQVAARHAELVRIDAETWRVVDLGSGRPTVVNGQPCTSAPLPEGSVLRIGPYRLHLTGGSVVAEGERSFSALSVRRLERQIGEVVLLGDVSFTVFSGEVVALVGPSGAGKTTLLNAINGIAPADSGEVRLDGQDLHALLAEERSLVGNVPQDDLVHPELTVAQSLFYSGRLRLPPGTPDAEIRTQVDRVLSELDIAHIRDSRIGDALQRGISGGQRKRVNLGQELISDSTRILFLDEPTSGLDPRASQDIVRLVRQLADRGRIVFLVTHDLTPEVMAQVDHLLVLAKGGRLAYFGPPKEACSYFGVRTPDAIFNRFSDHSPEEWGERYRASRDFRKYVRTREHLLGSDQLDLESLTRSSEGQQARGRVRRPSALGQLKSLTGRYWKVKLRDRTGLMVLGIQPPLLAFFMWIVFPVPTAPFLFMLSLSALWFGMSAAVRELISDRVIWRRERRVGVGVGPYVGSKVVVLGILVALQCIALANLAWWPLDMGSETWAYSLPQLMGVSVLTGWVGMSLGLLVSAWWTSSEAAVGTLPLLLIPQITFSSIMVSIRDMTWLAKLFTWATVQRYTFDATIKCGKAVGVLDRKGEWTDQRLLGTVYNLGLKFDDSNADDIGFTLPELVAILGGFSVVFLGTAAILVWRRGRDGRG